MRSPWFDPRSPDVELRHVLQEKKKKYQLKKKRARSIKKRNRVWPCNLSNHESEE